MKHIGWRVVIQRKLEPDVTFVHWFHRGVTSPVDDDGNWLPRFNWMLHDETWPKHKQTKVKSITKLYAE